MEQIDKSLLTPEQQQILAEFKSEPFFSGFYFTGGTALSEFYLKHRYSDDLDFFSLADFDSFALNQVISRWSKKLGFSYSSRQIEKVFSYDLKFTEDYSLKVDFAMYPYIQVEPLVSFNGLKVDSLQDIAVNKTVTLGQRTNVKDFVDFYYLSQKFGLFELVELSNLKFKRDYDPVLLACDFIKVEKFSFLPKMITNLTVDELKRYFLHLAKEMGGISVDRAR